MLILTPLNGSFGNKIMEQRSAKNIIIKFDFVGKSLKTGFYGRLTAIQNTNLTLN